MSRPYTTKAVTLALPLLAACSAPSPRPPEQPAAASPDAAPPPPAAPAAPGKGARLPYPEAAKRPVSNEYHGTRVVDDYQWLEDGSSPEVQRWVAAQNQLTRGVLDALPMRGAVRARVEEILSATSASYTALDDAGGQLFALKAQPPKQQPSLVVLRSASEPATERTLVDPEVIDPKGHTTIDWFVPSRDGKKVAVSLSEGGSEEGTVRVYDVATGKETGDTVPYASSGTAGGSLAWSGDGKGFYFTRHPHAGERPKEDMGFFQQIYFHKLGTPEKEDTYSLGKEFPRIAEVELKASESGRLVLASVQNGDGGEYWHYLLDATGKWTRFADLPDKIIHAAFGSDDRLYLLSRKDAPRGKVVRLAPGKLDLAQAELVVPEGEAVIQDLLPTKARLYVEDLIGGPSQIRVFDLKGKALGTAPIPPISSVRQLVRAAGDDMLFRGVSYTEPTAWYAYSARDGKVTKTPLAMTAPVSFADVEVTRDACASKDGTRVPVSILRRKGTSVDGTAPALLTGYGGYGTSVAPGFTPVWRLWFDQGGVIAVANLRGGGEFGEAWHHGGNLTRKQNVFDDFAACARHLVDGRFTSPERLAILGGSNGGLLMGAQLTQHPEMYKVVISHVGIYDMLRVELTPNGAFNVTEFGTVKDPEQFKALRAYSPYHHVQEGTAYPATLFLTGANDARVDPFHSRKMAARLQAATSGSGPILLRASGSTGHGLGTPLSAQIEEQADVLTFLFKELGLGFPPGKGEVAPAKGEVAPAKGEVAPAKGEVAPAKGEVAPAKGEGAPR
ncbi:prolyl oligopeptidase family serine peptidase [Sorangium sp. So ce321]|uniref:prolyl oligopeptidase family serine peptidase n=1 Tax=Sorangium sp. So ce321 TaxID=3133300 RepID=UPI003F600E61